MLAPPPRIWPAPPPAHVNGTSAATRYGYSSLAQILPSPQDKVDEPRQQLSQQGTSIYSEEPVKLRKETKHSNSTLDWRRKDRGRVKIEPGLTPCQVQEVTTSSKHEQNGSGGIPVGIAVARQRVQPSTPPPLTVLTCEERSTNQVTGWTPPHWHYPGVDQNLPLQVPPLQLGRDPLSGQLLILPSGSLGESMQRAVLWPSGNTGNSSAPPPLVMPGPQPVLLDRFVTLAPPPQATTNSGHHHQEKRRSHEHSTTAIHGTSNGGGLAVGLFPPPPPPQAPFLMMPFSHQNNSLLLSTQLTEHNLNTMVVTNHQLSESAVLNPMEVITSPVDGFASGSMIQQLPPSVVISHTETNSFVRSDINAVYPAHTQTAVQAIPQRVSTDEQEQIVVKEESELTYDAAEEELVEEESKAEVMDASNQTESVIEESEGEEDIPIKVENKEIVTEEVPRQEPDMSGLELLLNSIAQYERRSDVSEEHSTATETEPLKPLMKKENHNEWNDGTDNMTSGLGLLCSVAERCLEEEVVDEDCNNLDNQVSLSEEIQNQTEETVIENSVSPELEQNSPNSSETMKKELDKSFEKRGDWFAPTVKEKGKEMLKMGLKRRPGRPKKKSQIKKRRSPSRREPPVLQPWSASPDCAKSPLGSPPTLTPHKRKLSHDLSQESDEGNSSSGSSTNPPPLSPACSNPSSSKKRKVGRPKKRGETAPEKTETIVTKTLPCNKALVDLLLANKHQDHQQSSTGSHKIKPKLKAEAKVKDWCDDEELDLSSGKENELDDPLLTPPAWQPPTIPKVVALSPRKPKIKVEKNKVEKVLKKEEYFLPVAKSPLRTVIKSPKSPHNSIKQLPMSPGRSVQSQVKAPPSPSQTLQNENEESPIQVKPVSKIQTQVETTSPTLLKTSQIEPKQPTAPVSPKLDQSPVKMLPIPTKVSQSESKLSPSRANMAQSQTKSPQEMTKLPPVQLKSVQKVSSQRTPSSRVTSTCITPTLKLMETPSSQTSLQDLVGPKSIALQLIPDCKLSEEQLKSLPCRILYISNGQFYPGEVTKIIAPDIYEVHIYKERCRKPQILCREEIFSYAVAEMNCPEDKFIPSGTRVCAYWSQQYSCFYPGRVISDSQSGQVLIDFDDGDNGTIERSRVRFLPQDYPIVEQQPNPLAGKRKRYNSTTSSDSPKNSDTVEAETGCTPPGASNGKDVKVDIKEESPQDCLKTPQHLVEEEIDEKKDEESEDSRSIDDEGGASDAIRSVLEGFFKSEEEERERLKKGEKLCRRHNRKRRECAKLHKKCKRKHHRSHKHSHNRDDGCSSGSGNSTGSGFSPSMPSELAVLNKPEVEHNEKQKFEVTHNEKQNSELTPKGTDSDSSSETSKNSEGANPVACKSKSKIAAFLPKEHVMWSWVGAGVRRGRALGPRGKGLKIFYKAIQRGSEVINIGDCAVFLSTGRPDRPFIGHVESFWQCHMKKNMLVKVSWFYHPEETIDCPDNLPYPGALFSSTHVDNNDVQTISHKCEVLPLSEFRAKVEKSSRFLNTIYENNETYYLAGHYNPSETSLTLAEGVASKENENRTESSPD